MFTDRRILVRNQITLMAYTIEKVILVADQLRKFTHGYPHHVAGQFANIDFWLQEVYQSIQAIDKYSSRFTNIRNAQKGWVEAHGTVVHDHLPICGGRCEFSNGILSTC